MTANDLYAKYATSAKASVSIKHADGTKEVVTLRAVPTSLTDDAAIVAATEKGCSHKEGVKVGAATRSRGEKNVSGPDARLLVARMLGVVLTPAEPPLPPVTPKEEPKPRSR